MRSRKKRQVLVSAEWYRPTCCWSVVACFGDCSRILRPSSESVSAVRPSADWNPDDIWILSLLPVRIAW